MSIELIDNWYPDDPDLLMIHVDMDLYQVIKPECFCEAGCNCEDDYKEDEDETDQD